MTATLDAPTRSVGDGPPEDPPAVSRPVPAALAPWDDPHPRLGWLVLAFVVVVAGFTRFWALGFPPTKNFDEAYYPVEAQELLRYGYEDNRGYLFIVHPPLGKWLIAASEYLWDGSSKEWLTNSVGWRIAPALAGVLCVVIITRTVRRMMRSNLFGGIAGLLLALDGLTLVLSRTSILDIFLELFVLAGFAALVVDRDAMRGRLAGLIADGADLTGGVPSLGPRPWRLVAGVMFGAACAVKWSGLSFFLLFVVLSLVWDRSALRAAGVNRSFLTAARRSVLPAVGSLVVVPLGTYLLCWLGWFTGENSWNRHWADTHPGNALTSWLPDPVRSLLNYHHNAYKFHETLTSTHAYKSDPWSWWVLGRPVDFYYVGSNFPAGQPSPCGSPNCSREILLIGTPLMWWAFVPMMLWLVWHWVTTRDWRAGSVLVSLLSGWAIWEYYEIQDNRTMFLFYMAPFVPFLVIGLTLALGVMLGKQLPRPHAVVRAPEKRATVLERLPYWLHLPIERSDDQQYVAEKRRRWGTAGVAVFLALVIADFVWMWPIFTGGLLTYDQWHAHMWLPSWV